MKGEKSMRRMKFFSLSSGVLLLIIGASGCVNAKASTSSAPIIGDYQKASAFIKQGNIALEKGDIDHAKIAFTAARTACPFDEDATLGLARCAAAVRDFSEANIEYKKLIAHNEDDIDLVLEYVLSLQQSGKIQDAIRYYNSIVDICKQKRNVVPMEILPQTFRADGSDYNAVEMEAMDHMLRALNSSNDDSIRMDAEIDKAVSLSPKSSLIYFYKGVLINIEKKPGAGAAFRQALALDNGEHADIISKWINRSEK